MERREFKVGMMVTYRSGETMKNSRIVSVVCLAGLWGIILADGMALNQSSVLACH
jgi:hypothetical protein